MRPSDMVTRQFCALLSPAGNGSDLQGECNGSRFSNPVSPTDNHYNGADSSATVGLTASLPRLTLFCLRIVSMVFGPAFVPESGCPLVLLVSVERARLTKLRSHVDCAGHNES